MYNHFKYGIYDKEIILILIFYLSWNPYLKLLYKSWNFRRKFLNVLLHNQMRMEHFEVYVLKLI